MPTHCSVLLLTVGTGTAGRPVETVIEPFRKSLEQAAATRNILLPSQETLPIAEKIRETFPQFSMEIRPLPNAGDENNADRCFQHYDTVIASVLAAGVDAADIIADITRGTKAMSAALLLAAAVRGVRRVRYLVGGQRDQSGMAVAGTEQVSDIEPSFIFTRQTLLRAGELLRAGNFRAVERLVPACPPAQTRRRSAWEMEAAVLGWAARFWGAWDRFDYAAARELLDSRPADPPPALAGLMPTPGQESLLRQLAAPLPTATGERVKHCRALAADLLANAERRLSDNHLEEVLVRVSRILELMTAYRLLSHGIDAERLDPSKPQIRAWLGLRSHAGRPASVRPPRALGRKQAAELLVFLESARPGSRGAQIAARLAQPASWLGFDDAQLRNGSILIHGLSSTAAAVAARLPESLAALRNFFYEEHPNNHRLHLTASYPFLSLR